VPTLSTSQRAGYRGEAFVEKLVADAGFIWNARAKDFGIDGQIELVDRNGSVTGAAVLVQVKATEVGFPRGQDGRLRFTCQADHIDYWLRCNDPVVIVCVDLTAQRAWWKRLDLWFSDPHRRVRRVVELDEVKDELTVDTAADLAPLCMRGGQALPRLRGSELLSSNLLPVLSFAPLVYSASTPCRERGDAWERMRANDAFESGFDLAGGRISSLMPLEDSPLAVLCDGPASTEPTDILANSTDPDVARRFVRLLNYTLRAMHHKHLVWHPKKKVLYFQAPPDLRRQRIKGRTSRGRGRSFFTPYFGKDDVEKVRFCRHYAADLRFRRWDGQWYLEINPDYHFTIDGRRDSLFDAEYVKKIKRLERNGAVRHLVVAWADFLRGREGDLFTPGDERIVFADLLTLEADAVVNERVWIAPREAPGSEPFHAVAADVWADE
jgi:hypothetical protein